MTIYEAEYSKEFMGYAGELCTARSKLGMLINSTWFHSMHWGKTQHWLKDAQASLKAELGYCNERARELQQAANILDAIEEEE